MLSVGALVLWAGGYFGQAGTLVSGVTQKAALSAGLDVRRVTLRGAHNTANEEVRDALGPIIGGSILHVDLDAAKARVEEIGWIDNAAVSRLLPNTLHVSVRERAPAAVWQVNGEIRLIDNLGAVIRQVSAHEYTHLPMIVGVGAPAAAAPVLQALEKRADLADQTYALVRIGERRWNMRLRSGVDIKLPEDDFDVAIDSLWRLHTTQRILDQDIEYIDFRDADRVIVRRKKSKDEA